MMMLAITFATSAFAEEELLILITENIHNINIIDVKLKTRLIVIRT